MKKRWLLAPVMGVLLVLGVMVGAVVAQDTNDVEMDVNDEDIGLADKLISEMAQRLDIDEEDVEEAMIGTFGHLAFSHLELVLDRLVEDERLTEDEADEVRTWYEDRPDAADRAFFFGMVDAMERRVMEGLEKDFDGNRMMD